MPTDTTSPRLADLMPLWRTSRVGAGCRPRGIEAYSVQLERFFTWMGAEATVAELTRERILQYQDHVSARWNALTIGQALSAIRAFCRFLVDRRYREDDPTVGVRWPKRRDAAPRALTPAQVAELTAAIAVPTGLEAPALWIWRRERRIILLMLYAGLRRCEVHALLWRDVDLGTRPGEGHLVVREGKGGKDRLVPLHSVLRDELLLVESRRRNDAVAGRLDGERLTLKSIGHTFDRWLAARGVDTSPHVLRHTFATSLMRAGVDLRLIQDAMGHESLETTQRYLKIDPGRLRGAIDALPSSW